MKSFYFIFLMIFLTSIVKSGNEYKLYLKKNKADINYLTFKNITYFPKEFSNEIFQSFHVKGEYRVYIFIKEFEGSICKFDDDCPEKYRKMKMHNLLIIKTNKNDSILDGFHYLLEHSEVPSQFGIYRIYAENIYLKNNLKLSELDLTKEYELSEQIFLDCKDDVTKL